MTEALRGPSDVEAALRAWGISWRPMRASGSRAAEAAQSLGVELAAIVKSLLFLADDEPVLVLVAISPSTRISEAGTRALSPICLGCFTMPPPSTRTSEVGISVH